MKILYRHSYKFISFVMDLKFRVIAAIALGAAILVYLLFMSLDFLPSNYLVDNGAMKIFTARQSSINFLFRVAPLLLTIVISITSLTINTYSGTFLELLLKDKRIKFFILYSVFYLAFHILVIFFVESSVPSDYKEIEEYYIKNFCIYLIDLLLSLGNSILALHTAFRVFQYSWPVTLKQRFLKNIRKTLSEVEEKPLGTKAEIDNFKTELNQQIGLFINLLLKAIKSKDYDSTRDILGDIGSIWKEIVTYTSESKQEQDDKQFKELLDKIKGENPELDLKSDYAGEVYEIGLSKIAHVFSDAFEIAFSNGEYHICEIILESIFNLTHLEKIDNEDIRKRLKIFVEIFNISLRFDKKGQTPYFTQKTLLYINKIYDEAELKDFDVYYDIILICLKLDDPKVLKESLAHFKKTFDIKSTNDDVLYKDTIIQFQGTLVYCLKNKRMKCFAELIRFFVIGDINLKIVNQVFSEKIIIVEKDLELLQEFIEELTEDPSDLANTYNAENYIRVKMYVVWYSYYLLQCRISKDRILFKYRNLNIPATIKNKVPFELIRTVLLDLETHQSNWKKLFVGQEGYYACKIAIELLDRKDYKKISREIKEFDSSEFLKKANELVKPELSIKRKSLISTLSNLFSS